MPTPAWLPDVEHRVIEFDPPDSVVADVLLAHGRSRYLALGRWAHGEPGPRSALLRSAVDVRRHNADVVVLNGGLVSALWYRRIGRARHAVVPSSPAAAREARLACRLHGRPVPRPVTWGGRDFLVVDLPASGVEGARYYCSELVGLEKLAAELGARQVRYAVLRWFDRLPHVDPGEDLDVLVADDDLAEFLDVLEAEPGTVPVDVYSETGLPGTDFKSVAYYPPSIAAGIVARAVRLPSGFSAPAPEDHFLSLTYHALYHKGFSSGIASSLRPRSTPSLPDHDYVAFLTELGRAHGFEAPLTLESLDEHLATRGWRPPHDTLAKLSAHNEWVDARFFAGPREVTEPPELTVYLLRERAADDASIALASSTLASHGFDVVHAAPLSAEAQLRCTNGIRGGNWGKGPFARSGGAPAVLLVALHDAPERPGPAEAKRHPGLSNAHTLRGKLDLRDRLLASVPEPERFNPLHSSDSDAEGWHYLELADPELVPRIRAVVAERRAARRAGAGPSESVAGPSPRDRVSGVARRLAERGRAGVHRLRWIAVNRLRNSFVAAVDARLERAVAASSNRAGGRA